MLLLIFYLRKRIGKLGLKKILFSGLKSFAAAAATGISAWYACKISANLFISVPAALLAAAAAFFITAKILKSEELGVFLEMLKKTNNN